MSIFDDESIFDSSDTKLTKRRKGGQPRHWIVDTCRSADIDGCPQTVWALKLGKQILPDQGSRFYYKAFASEGVAKREARKLNPRLMPRDRFAAFPIIVDFEREPEMERNAMPYWTEEKRVEWALQKAFKNANKPRPPRKRNKGAAS